MLLNDAIGKYNQFSVLIDSVSYAEIIFLHFVNSFKLRIM